MKRAFFFDRDGVVNQDPHPELYVLTWGQWKWMPGIFALLEEVRRQGFLAILVTSQKAVGKGLLPAAALEEIHERMQATLGDLRFDGIYAYTGEPDCPWEAKPSPQMIESAAQRFGISLEQSWLIGDANRDMQMGRAARVGKLVRFAGLKPLAEKGDFLVHDLAEALECFKNRGNCEAR